MRYIYCTPPQAVVGALIKLQALRLPGAVELCETSAERSLGAVTLVERGSILMFQTILTVSPTRKAVVADRHNYADRHSPISYVIYRALLIAHPLITARTPPNYYADTPHQTSFDPSILS